MRAGGETQYVSSRVREKSIEALRILGRPLAAQEFTEFFKEKDPKLFEAVTLKCRDYMRMILTQAKNGIVKYKPTHDIEGIDKRTNFFGLSVLDYSKEDWIKLEEDAYEMEMSTPDPEPEPPKKQISFHETDEELASKSWRNLGSNLNFSDPLFHDLTNILTNISRRIYVGEYEAIDVEDIIENTPTLKNSPFQDDILNIINRQITMGLEMMEKATIL